MSAARRAKVDEQHLRLLEGLAASIRGKGLAQAQVGDIVRHARASRRTFYKHFPDKDSCLVELVELTAEVVVGTVAAAIDRDAPRIVQIDQAVDAYLAMLTVNPEMTLAFSGPGIGDRVVRAQRDGLERVAALVVSTMSEAISIERAYMLVSGLRDTVLRAVGRGEDPAYAAAEGKAVIRAAVEAADAAAAQPR